MGRRPSISSPKAGWQEKHGRVSGITFDAGGLIALDRGDRGVLALD
jgi:hypothetical protein